MSLALFEKELDHVDVQFRRLRHWDAVRGRCSGRWFAHPKQLTIADWHDLSDRSLATQHGDRLAPSYDTQVLTEPCLQFSDPDLLHGHIVTINSHDGKFDTRGTRDPEAPEEPEEPEAPER
jgi:hypothetical protein